MILLFTCSFRLKKCHGTNKQKVPKRLCWELANPQESVNWPRVSQISEPRNPRWTERLHLSKIESLHLQESRHHLKTDLETNRWTVSSIVAAIQLQFHTNKIVFSSREHNFHSLCINAYATFHYIPVCFMYSRSAMIACELCQIMILQLKVHCNARLVISMQKLELHNNRASGMWSVTALYQ